MESVAKCHILLPIRDEVHKVFSVSHWLIHLLLFLPIIHNQRKYCKELSVWKLCFFIKKFLNNTEVDCVTQATKIISFQELSAYSCQKDNNSSKWHISIPARVEVLRTFFVVANFHFFAPHFSLAGYLQTKIV